MKFRIESEVFEKFPDLFVAIPIIQGFDNSWNEDKEKLLTKFKENAQKTLIKEVEGSDEIVSHPYIKAYFEAFEKFGANPKRTKPTHFALASRVVEGGNLPRINPIVDLYNSFSIKYITPFGGEDLSKVYGDFVMKFAKGDEHWLGISEEKAKSPKIGDLIWADDYDVSTLSLNWRQCERTKLTEESKDGYFIMDGFKGINEKNILKAANEFIDYVTSNFGGKGFVITLDIETPEVEIDYKSKDIEGVSIPVIQKVDQVKVQAQKKEEKTYEYDEGSIEEKIQVIVYDSVLTLSKDLLAGKNRVVIIKNNNNKFGDYSTTVAMNLAEKLKKAPIKIAQELAGNIKKLDFIDRVETVNPGYINFFIKSEEVKSVVNSYSEEYGKGDIGRGKQVMVEFGQPNTHKALQLGHFKSAVTGLPIARLYANLGYDVIKANYFGDIGLQVSNCIWGVINRNGTWYSKLSKEDVAEIKESLDQIVKEKGIDEAARYLDQSYVFGRKLSSEKENVLEEVKDINMKIYNRSDENIIELYEYTREISIKHQDKAFKELGVEYDIQYPESVVWKNGKEIVTENIGKVFTKDAGAVIFEGEKYGLQRWVFLTSAGFPSYSGKDLGLAVKKFTDYPSLDLAIVTTSVEQNAYFKAMIKALELIFPNLEGKYMHIGFGWLLFENKKMSSKTGKNVKYTDLIAEAEEIARKSIGVDKGYSNEEKDLIAHTVAMGALKFAILSHELHKDINWDIDKFMSMTGFAAPYILYSYARGLSILRNCKYEFRSKELELDKVLNSEVEIELLKKIGEYPELVKNAANNISPHLLCRYIYELSESFNKFYGEFNIQNERDLNVKESRLRLVYITTEILKKALYILGIDTVEQM
ncbi:arginine--tRNA ligase [Candidatus Dojkabacteria bacterium]|nr:arginine--tRNA ligase [Candidatus Dojkabacteria bacterium]